MDQNCLAQSGAMPLLGQGTSGLAEIKGNRAQEIAALRLGIELGVKLIDTAEMYADGAAEVLVGDAINGIPRNKL